MNGRLLDFSSPLAEVDVSRGCGFADAVCDPNPCGNGGRCVGEWNSYFCDCPVEFAGPECLQGKVPISHSYNGRVKVCLVNEATASEMG